MNIDNSLCHQMPLETAKYVPELEWFPIFKEWFETQKQLVPEGMSEIDAAWIWHEAIRLWEARSKPKKEDNGNWCKAGCGANGDSGPWHQRGCPYWLAEQPRKRGADPASVQVGPSTNPPN